MTAEEKQRYERLYALAVAAEASNDPVQSAALFGRAGCIKREALKRARQTHQPPEEPGK
jgi:hypothetical protein